MNYFYFSTAAQCSFERLCEASVEAVAAAASDVRDAYEIEFFFKNIEFLFKNSRQRMAILDLGGRKTSCMAFQQKRMAKRFPQYKVLAKESSQIQVLLPNIALLTAL